LRVTRRLIRLFGNEMLFVLFLAAVVGVGAGYGAIGFHLLIGAISRLAYAGRALADVPWYWLLAVPALGGAVVGPLVHFLAREARGHGVPEVMDAVANRRGRIRPRVAAVKTIASAISIGVGAAVGREGPIVQIGSSLGSTVGQLLHIDAHRLKLLVGCGAAAGIAATFNAPIAGCIFAVEVILGTGNVQQFTPLVVSSVLATAVSRFHLGDHPAFAVPRYELINSWELALYVVLGVLCALVGTGFSRGLYFVEDQWAKLRLHDALKPVLGGLAVGGIGLVLPQVMGNGYDTISQALNGNHGYSAWLLLAILFGKMIATPTSLASGFSGGVFAPSLFLGAILGAAFGDLAHGVLPPNAIAPSGAYALVAMGAVVAAASHSPLTAFLIVFELTGDYKIILPLMLACFIASMLSMQLSRESIYTLKLARRGVRIGTLQLEDVVASASVEAHMREVAGTLRPNTPFAQIIEQTLAHAHEVLYVTTEEGTLCGSVTRHNVTSLIRDEAVLQHVLIAEDIMQPSALTLRPDDTLQQGLRFLGSHPLAEVPVVDEAGHLVGTLSRREVLAVYDREVLKREASVLTFMQEQASDAAVDIASGAAVRRLPVSPAMCGRSIRELDLRNVFAVQVIGVQAKGASGNSWDLPDPGQPLRPGDTLMVTGSPDAIARLLFKLA
jgi:CIC family chloride channel protein